MLAGAVAVLVCIAPAAAQAATVTYTPSSLGFPNAHVTVTMGSVVSTVTLLKSGSSLRVRETGDTLTGDAVCVKDAADVVCPEPNYVRIENTGGSSDPANGRDVIVVSGSAHGDDPATRVPYPVSLQFTAGLVEFFGGDASGLVLLNGSDIAVGSAAQPADIFHLGGTGGLLFAKSGADRIEGSTDRDNISGGAGDDVIFGRGGDDSISGDDASFSGTGNDVISGGLGADTIDGGPGIDMLRYSDPERVLGMVATLASGASGSAGSVEDGAGDAYSGIEQFVGTPLGDTLYGGDATDTIDGAGGDDRIRGGRSADILNGGTGTDIIDYGERTAPVSVVLTAPGLGGNADDGAGDGLTGFESIAGGAGNDVLSAGPAPATLSGNGGADTLTGGPGDDVLDGGSGPDSIDGRVGADAVDYSDRTDPLAITLGGGGQDDGGASDGLPGARDALTSVEVVKAGAGDDVLVGSDAAERLTGGAGDDVLDGGAGADAIDGGAGRDLVTFAGRADPIGASLAAGTGSDGDTLTGIEDLRGGSAGDALTGGDGPNRIEGGAGNDTITGNGAPDELFGGSGGDTMRARDGVRDTVDCGAQIDTIDVDETDLLKDCDVAAPLPPDADGDGTQDSADCAPNDAKIRPGAIEIPGNKVDENCDGIIAPFALTTASIVYRTTRSGLSTRISRLNITRVPAGATVRLTCTPPKARKRSCPFKAQKVVVKKAAATLRLAPRFKRQRLPTGTVVAVSVFAPGVIGKRLVLTLGRRSRQAQSCLTPAGARTKCP